MPVGPLTLVCFAVALVFAFLRARADQLARRERVLEKPDGDTGERVRLSAPELTYTEEGEAQRQRAIRYRLLFLAFALGALAAAWFGL